MTDKPIPSTENKTQSNKGEKDSDKKNTDAERALDEALEESFPASDPVAIIVEKQPKNPDKKTP